MFFCRDLPDVRPIFLIDFSTDDKNEPAAMKPEVFPRAPPPAAAAKRPRRFGLKQCFSFEKRKTSLGARGKTSGFIVVGSTLAAKLPIKIFQKKFISWCKEWHTVFIVRFIILLILFCVTQRRGTCFLEVKICVYGNGLSE